MEFTITSQQILWICGFIASVWGVVKIIKEIVKEFKKPSDDLKETVNRHGQLLNNDNERLKAIEVFVKLQGEVNKKIDEHTQTLAEHNEKLEADKQRGNLMLKANIAILDGLLSEGDKENLKETRKEIQEYLVDKN
jgi:hypothetical protein